jgi:hypothetical protein
VPGIYFHSLFGSRGWLEGVRQTGHPRTVNREKLELQALERELQRPGSRRAHVFQRFAGLLRARRASPAFHPNASQTVLDLGEPIFGLVRITRETGEPVVCLHNLSDRRVTCPPVATPGAGSRTTRWTDLTSPAAPRSLEHPFELAPYQVAWLQPEQWQTGERSPDWAALASDEVTR